MRTVIHTDAGGSIIVRPLPSGRVNLGLMAGQTGLGAPLTVEQARAVIDAVKWAVAQAVNQEGAAA